jgi:uncharacterized membrane protein
MNALAPRTERALFIDAARGIAMMFVLGAHFIWIYFAANPGREALATSLSHAMQIAPPTFMMLSGLLFGYVYEIRKRNIRAFIIKLRDRGLFLLTVGHVVISLAYVAFAGSISQAFRYGQILDAVGFSIIVGPLIVLSSGPRARTLLGAVLFGLCWVVIVLWHPNDSIGQWVKHTLFGAEPGSASQWRYNFPVLPWFCVYLVATGFGERVARLHRSREFRALTSLLVGWGIALIVLAGTVRASFIVGKAFGLVATTEAKWLWLSLADFYQKLPPSLNYFALHAGMGMLMLAGVLWVEQRRAAPGLLRMASIVGQNSLFVFLLQEHVYVMWLWLLDPPYSVWWPLMLLASISLILGITLFWHRIGGTRFFTVGYGRMWGPKILTPAHPQAL